MQDVLWVPSDPSQFVTWGSDIRHYSVTREQDVERTRGTEHVIPLGGEQVALHLATLQEPQYVRCADLWPGDGVILAAGQASGRISFVSFRDGEGKFLVERGELTPRTSRTCSAVSWYRGPGHASILASGYEKHRTDNAIAVWDLTQVIMSDSVLYIITDNMSQGRMTDIKPVVEFGLTDSCCSLAWFQSSTLAAGMNGKIVRWS